MDNTNRRACSKALAKVDKDAKLRKVSSPDLSAMVLQPHIASAIVDYVYQSYNLPLLVYKPADLCTLKSRTRTLGRILQVCKAFYHPAARHLYSSLSLDLAGKDPGSNSLLGPLKDTGTKTALLLYTKHLRIGGHTAKECGAFASSGGSTLPNLQTLVLDTTHMCDEVDSCYANVCELNNKLKPTDKLLLVADAEAFSPAEWPISAQSPVSPRPCQQLKYSLE